MIWLRIIFYFISISGEDIYQEKKENLYIADALTGIFYRTIGVGFSEVDCIRKMFLILKHINRYIKLVRH